MSIIVKLSEGCMGPFYFGVCFKISIIKQFLEVIIFKELWSDHLSLAFYLLEPQDLSGRV